DAAVAAADESPASLPRTVDPPSTTHTTAPVKIGWLAPTTTRPSREIAYAPLVWLLPPPKRPRPTAPVRSVHRYPSLFTLRHVPTIAEPSPLTPLPVHAAEPGNPSTRLTPSVAVHRKA